MNRIVPSVAVALLLFCGSRSQGQDISNNLQDSSYRLIIENDTLTSNVPLNEISAKAMRNFTKGYGSIAHSAWHKYHDGYLVRFFTADSVGYYLYFTLEGRLYRTMAHFTPQNTPAEVQADVKSVYANYSILYTSEFCEGDRSIYNVCLMAPDQSLRLIELKNGDMRTIMEFDQ